MNLRIAAVATFALAFTGAAFAQQQETPVAGEPQGAIVTSGDTLLVERVQEENSSAMPARGMSMQEVEAKFGAPAKFTTPGPNGFCAGEGPVRVTVCTAAGSPIAMLASFGA